MTPWITKPVPFNIGQGAAAAVSTCTPGTLLESITGTTEHDEAPVIGQVIWNKMQNLTNVDDCYDQIAILRGAGTSGGNYRQGVYDLTPTEPNDLLSETSSITIPAIDSYTFQSLPEFNATTTQLYGAFMVDNTTAKFVRRQPTDLGDCYYRNGYTYGTLPQPAGGTITTSAWIQKIGHT